jgi:hypothetical protein
MSGGFITLGAAEPVSPDVEIAESESRSAAERFRLRSGWNRDEFARRQIQGLVQQIFVTRTPRAIRQVVFTGLEPDVDLRHLGRDVAEVLAKQTPQAVAVVQSSPRIWQTPQDPDEDEKRSGMKPLHRIAKKMRDNLWILSAPGPGVDHENDAGLHMYLKELRREFEYSIVESQFAADCHETVSMGRASDGVVLVLSAKNTRRAVAVKAKEALDRANIAILGTVLMDRTFPVPEGIYRRL